MMTASGIPGDVTDESTSFRNLGDLTEKGFFCEVPTHPDVYETYTRAQPIVRRVVQHWKKYSD